MTTHTPEQPDDAALERLRAADPAAGLDPDTEALEAAVRTRVPEAFAGADAALSRARSRLRAAWAEQASVAQEQGA